VAAVKQLLLLRHAEAESAPPGSKDHDRALTEHGRREAAAAALVIAAVPLHIDLILVSPARRTRETAALVATRLGLELEKTVVNELYLASPDDVLQVLSTRAGTSSVVLLVGHNPGLTELACQLSGDLQLPSLRTAGLCRLTWSQAGWDAVGTVPVSTCAILR
jgi:phosphohistidine phosphatase